MALELRANTAVDVLIGPFVDKTDGDTEETGLTISQGDVLLSKNGQALAQKNDANAAAHDADGYYNCPLDTTDTNTEGNLVLEVHESGALPVRHEFDILSEAAWDSKYVAKDDGFMDVNIKTVGRTDTQETEANNLESACANYSATRGLTGTALPAAAADAAGGLPISDAGGLDMDNLHDAAGTDAAAKILADPTHLLYTEHGTGYVGLAKVAHGGAGATLTLDTLTVTTNALAWNAAWDAEVESEASDALVVLRLDHLLAVADADDVVDNAVMAKIASTTGDWSTFAIATDALQSIRDRGDAAWITFAGGAVASVAGNVGGSIVGNVNGKVLGGGAGVITAVGAWALDGAGAAIAPAGTALSTATWTNARAGYLDELAAANLPTDVANVQADTTAILADTAAMQPQVTAMFTGWEADGAVYRLTTNALEQAPSGTVSVTVP